MSACSSVAIVGVSTALLALPPLALVVRSLRVGNGYGLDHFRALAHETPALLVARGTRSRTRSSSRSARRRSRSRSGSPRPWPSPRGRGGLDTLVMLPLGASAAMLGFGFLLAFDEPPLDLRSSAAIVPIAQSLVAIPFVVRALAPTLRASDVRLREAAAVLGASPARIRREIELPLLARPLAVAAGLAFAVALGEFGATVFVARADWPTVPVAIFRFLGRPGADNVGTAMALCVVLMGLVAATALASERASPVGPCGVSLVLEDVDVVLDGSPIVRDVGLSVGTGERLAVLGPSGSGKSTILRVATGLLRPSRGRVLLDGNDVTGEPPHRRGIGLVFQDAGALPAPGRRRQRRLRAAGREAPGGGAGGARPRGARPRRARRARSSRDVATLSGGEAQRVALARALAPRPGVLLLDEPSARSTARCASACRPTCARSSRQLHLTVVHVTHDVGEAFALGDRVAILRDGRVAQVAPPDELWARPADEWVARFLGMRNVAVEGATATVTRPEAVRLVPGDGAVVVATERDGPVVRVRVRLDEGGELEALATRVDHPRIGDRAGVQVDPDGIVRVPVFDPSAGDR